MKPLVDYHLHTELCGHATGKVGDYVRTAIRRGLKEIGFADHAPLLLPQRKRYTMFVRQLPLYRRWIEALQKEFPQLRIRIGLEADYIPGFEKRMKVLLSGYPYDYLIGSVHFIKGWAFDDPDLKKRWEKHQIDKVYRDYYKLLRMAARSGLFDIMGHVDLVKKFGHRPSGDLGQEVRKTAKVFKEYGMVVEINSSGLRKPVAEIYPSLEALRTYRKAGVPITFSSDAHSPKEVGADFDQARRLALAAGYRDYVTFEKRKIKKKLRL